MSTSPSPQRVATRYLSAASVRLVQKTKSAVTGALVRAGLDGNGRFKTLGAALAKAGDVLGQNGIEWGEVINSHALQGDRGTLNIDLALTNPEDSFSPTAIDNSMLSFQWYLLTGGQYEVVAYLS